MCKLMKYHLLSYRSQIPWLSFLSFLGYILTRRVSMIIADDCKASFLYVSM